MPARTDRILWDAARDSPILEGFLNVPPDLAPDLKAELLRIIQDNWDAFAPEGARRPMLGFQFCIETGASPPVACRQSHYGIHESPILQQHINDLLDNGHIHRTNRGGWLSKALLAPKPHQEHVHDIHDFIWRFCVNFRGLNAVTEPYLYPIPRCDDTLDNFGDGSGRRLYFISFDAKSGYHQIAVWEPHQCKLSFYGPDFLKYCFGVMPFGPLNAPAVYTAIMQILRTEAYELFCSRHPELAKEVDSRQIIDDGLMWSYDPFTLLKFFACLCEIYVKYRLSFNGKKCDFFLDRFEWMGNDITANGNSPAISKFDLVRDWTLPTTGDSLLSFCGFIGFYSKYIAQYESRAHPLRTLARRYHRKPLPATAWTPELKALFEGLKVAVTSDPCLARYSSKLPTFLKTDWSGKGMSYILMQPADTKEAQKALDLIAQGGENLFDTLMNGARLRPVRFGARRCTIAESKYHSFTGEAVSGRWSMGQNRRYLWGAYFYWLCDCNYVKAVLMYEGPLHTLSRISQELFSYHFTVLHRPSRMMRDVDALNRFWEPLILDYETRLHSEASEFQEEHPFAYSTASFSEFALKCPAHPPATPPTTICNRMIAIPARTPRPSAPSASPAFAALSLLAPPDSPVLTPTAPEPNLHFVSSALSLLPNNETPTARSCLSFARTLSQPAPARQALSLCTRISLPGPRCYPPQPVETRHNPSRQDPPQPAETRPDPSRPAATRQDPPQPAPPAVTNFPILITRTSEPAHRPLDTQVNRSTPLLSAACPSGWISINTRTGSFPYSLSRLDPSTEPMPILILEDQRPSAAVCRMLLPHATVLDFPDLALKSSLPTILSVALRKAPPNRPPDPGAMARTEAFLREHTSLLGLDFHCTPAQVRQGIPHWLDTACTFAGLLAQHRALRCFLCTAPLPLTDHRTAASLSAQFSAWASSIGWHPCSGLTSSSLFGDAVSASRWIAYAFRAGPHTAAIATFPSAETDPTTPFELFDADPPDPDIFVNQISLPDLPPCPEDQDPFLPYSLWRLSPPSLPNRHITVYDPYFPIPEAHHHANTVLGHGFAIMFPAGPGKTGLRVSSAEEVLRLYSFPFSDIPLQLDYNLSDSLLPCLTTSLPFSTARRFAQHIFRSGVPTGHSASTHVPIQCLSSDILPVPKPADWTQAYRTDPDTARLLEALSANPQPTWTAEITSNIHRAYLPYLEANAIGLRGHFIIVRQQLLSEGHSLSLIVVPQPLRSLIFSAYHASPTSAHLGRYKTLHRIRQRFFWPTMTAYIINACKECGHCLASKNATQHSSQLDFSWPVTSPFFILHVDLWQPGQVNSSKASWVKRSTHLLAAMCDLTGFILCEDTCEPDSASLAELFMKSVLLKVGFCGLVVIDADSKFRGTFESMCEKLGLNFHALSKRNHKGLSVERFFRTLNKAVMIACQDRAAPPSHLFSVVAQTTAYAWNASAIDGTDIIRSVAAVGRVFQFPFDITLSDPPEPVSGDLARIHDYLRLGQAQSVFATEILAYLTEDRRAYHRERVNLSRTQKLFQTGDIVFVRVSVQSKASTGRVAKLSYCQRGPYEIVDASGTDSYSVRLRGKPNAAVISYKAQDLTLAPPRIHPPRPVDTSDFRFLNKTHNPIHNPLRSVFNIKRYNDTWLSTPRDKAPPAIDTDTSLRPLPADPAHTTSSTDVNDDAILRVPSAPMDPLVANLPGYDPASLFAAISASTDRLFFLRYLPPGALRPRWYLGTVDLALTNEPDTNCGDPQVTGRYYVHFLARHPSDSNEPDATARWWPEWHEYTTDSDGYIDYGDQVTVFPTQTPDASRYIAWADVITLSNPEARLLGPFDFLDPSRNPPDRSPSFRQYVPLLQWQQLHAVCIERSIQPPVLALPDSAPDPLPTIPRDTRKPPPKRRRSPTPPPAQRSFRSKR